MSLPNESVTLPTSGLTFINYYDATVTPEYRGAVLQAENFLQAHFTDTVTVNIHFGFADLGAKFSGQNSYSQINVSYSQLVGALASHATTADDRTAIAGLPASDPSGGTGFAIPIAQAVILGLAPQTNAQNDSVTLNSSSGFTFGQDAVGVLEHEITEGVFGRSASLGFSGRWATLDLFRFNAFGERDFTGGSEGVPTFFGIDANHLTGLQYHGSINAQGVDDNFDLGDWDHTRGDAFGPGGPSSPGVVTAADLQVLDVIGWNPVGSGAPYAPAPDEFASDVTGSGLPFGQLLAGGSASGVLQRAGDRDVFQVSFQAGGSYTISEIGHFGGGGTLGDAYLRLYDASGNLVAENDDITSGRNPDARIVFTATTGGTYYVSAGSFLDGFAGSYRLDLSGPPAGGGSPSTTPTEGPDTLAVSGANTEIHAGGGNDTIAGGTTADYLRGDDGDDSISGGSAFDDINGNMGNDTAHGNGGDDWVVGGKDNDMLFGDAGGDIVWGNLGNDTLDGGDGADQVRGGQGDDVLNGGAGDDFVSGDRGNDTVTGGAGADLFHGSQDAGIDRVLDFSLAEGDRVMLDPGTTYTLSQVGADTVIDMGASSSGAPNQMILVGVQLSTLTGNWIFEG
ncbi:MAG: NF038122 family metalloprotease [Phenylobacterium sp.]